MITHLDINNLINIIWKSCKFHISFDCALNGCEVHSLLIEKLICNNNYISWKTETCKGSGPFDMLVDGSVILLICKIYDDKTMAKLLETI